MPADNHRLELRMVDVGGNDRASPRHLGPNELGIETLSDRDELHLWRDDAAPRVVQLSHRPGSPERRSRAIGKRRRHRWRASRYDRQRPVFLSNVTPGLDPRLPEPRETVADVVTLRSARVVDAKWKLAAAKRNLPHRHAQIAGLDVNFARVGECGSEI